MASWNDRKGQALPVVILALCILIIALLWMLDAHRIIFLKDRTQNAGDAASLAGARWQATTLNFIGELNLMHAFALSYGDEYAIDVITNTQKRISFTGPMTGVAAAQQAGKLNGIYVNEDYTEFLKEHASLVRNGYASIVSGTTALTEPWDGAWNEYAVMIDAVARGGIAVGIDNAILYTDASDKHWLLNINFYDAVQGRNWCWFHLNAPYLPEEYTDYKWWPDIPESSINQYNSSEFLSVKVMPREFYGSVITANKRIQEFGEEFDYDIQPVVYEEDEEEIVDNWFTYDQSMWQSWDVMKSGGFPIDGELKSEYDYYGADSVMRVEAEMQRISENNDNVRDSITWTSAAKPFGYIEDDGEKRIPNEMGLVLPAFRDVRLIPIDASTAPSGGAFNLKWRVHCKTHVPAYLKHGQEALSESCRYCRNIRTWDVPLFREQCSIWLETNSWKCVVRPSGGGSGGGTSHAH